MLIISQMQIGWGNSLELLSYSISEISSIGGIPKPLSEARTTDLLLDTLHSCSNLDYQLIYACAHRQRVQKGVAA